MNWRKHFIEAATLIAAAILCALVANAMASRERKMQLVANYPNATKVPAQVNGGQAPPPVQPTVQPEDRRGRLSSIPPPPTTTTQQPSNPTTKQLTPPAKPVIVQAEQFPPHPDKPYIEIAFDSVKQLYDRKALFLDARRSSVYEQGHIPGARPFSVWESDIDEKVNKLFEERGDPRQQAEPIVVYCSGGDCEDSHMLAQKLWGIQYNNVYVYKDGFPDWEKRGAPAHTGAAP
jgi:rhodanese-related sulfurtransferase